MFIVSLGLIAVGVLASPIFLPTTPLFVVSATGLWYDLLITLLGAFAGAFLGTWIAVITKRRDEYAKLKSELFIWLRLDNEELCQVNDWVEEDLINGGWKLTSKGATHLFTVRHFLHNTVKGLRGTGHWGLYNKVQEAYCYFNTIDANGIDHPLDLWETVNRLREEVPHIKPNYLSLLLGRALPQPPSKS